MGGGNIHWERWVRVVVRHQLGGWVSGVFGPPPARLRHVADLE